MIQIATLIHKIATDYNYLQQITSVIEVSILRKSLSVQLKLELKEKGNLRSIKMPRQKLQSCGELSKLTAGRESGRGECD